MSAAQEVGFMRPEYHGELDIRIPKLRPPPTNFFVYATEEDPYPTTPPGFLTMSDTMPPDSADEAAALAAEPNAFPRTERRTRPETLRPSVRDFNRAVDEMTLTRKEIADGFRQQGADLAFIRHELQGQSMRLTKVEDGQRDMRAELRQVKDDLRGALQRIEELERRYDSAPPAASSR
jgi:hypothetical protein